MDVDTLVHLIQIKDKNLNDTAIRELIAQAREEWLDRTEFYGTLISKELSGDTESLAFTDIMADEADGGRIISVYNIQPEDGTYKYFPKDRSKFEYPDEKMTALDYDYTVMNDTVKFGRSVDSGTTLLFRVTYIPYQASLAISDIPSKYHRRLADYVLAESFDVANPRASDRHSAKWENSILECKGEIKLQTSGDNLNRWRGNDDTDLEAMKGGTVVISA